MITTLRYLVSVEINTYIESKIATLISDNFPSIKLSHRIAVHLPSPPSYATLLTGVLPLLWFYTSDQRLRSLLKCKQTTISMSIGGRAS